LPRGSIAPGTSGVIEVSYYTDREGPFSESVKVYSGNSSQPIKLTIKGNIKSFAPGALTECPTFKEELKPDQFTFVFKGMVVDKQTGQPIEGALVNLLQNTDLTIKIETPANGKFKGEIPIGLYYVNAYASGYRYLEMSKYLNRNSDFLLIEMEQLPVDEILTTGNGNDRKKEIALSEPEEEIIAVDDHKSEPVETPEPVIDQDGKKEELEYIVFEEDAVDRKSETAIPTREEEEPVETTSNVSIESPPPDLDDNRLPVDKFNPNNVVFLIDESRSMNKPDKLPLLKTAMHQLVDILRNIDRIAVITYATQPAVRLNSVSANNKDTIKSIIDSLYGEGMTFGLKGLQNAYQILESNHIEGGNNQVIIATDGMFSNASQTDSDLYSLVRQKMREGYILSVIGFGNDKDAIKRMKKMAYWGKGNYMHIETATRADDVLIDEIREHSLKEF